MFRVTSLSGLPDHQVDRLIRRIALLLVVGVVAFAAFYTFDRWRPASPSILDRELATLEQAVRDNPTDVSARGRLADVYVAAERFEDAIVQYDAVLETGKADRPAYMGRARARVALGLLDEAAADYTAVVEMSRDAEMANVDPVLQAAWYGLGEIALAQGRAGEAVDHLAAALRINRADADSLFLIGRAHLAAGDPSAAIESLRKAIAFVPIGWPEPYAVLAEAYVAAAMPTQAVWAEAMGALAAGDSDTAEARLLSIREGSAALEAAIGLGLVYETRGELPHAAEWYGRALALDPENAEARLGLGRVGAPDAGSGTVPGASTMPELPLPGQEAP